MGSYIPTTRDERAAMLADIGCSSIDELYRAVPDDVRCEALDIPEGKSELEVMRIMEGLAAKNTVFRSVFRGAGAYARYIPSLVTTVTSNEAFLTAYTPYQAEISQGVLQSIFEYQTMICELTGMDVANASLYDGASAAAEAVLMCGDRKCTAVVVSGAVNPQTIETVRTYCDARGVRMSVVEPEGGVTSPAALAEAVGADGACVLVQQPNYFGMLEDVRALVDAAHEAGAKAVVAAEPISLGILESPGACGADVCVAEGQPLGLPLSFGGPYLGIIACTKALMRKLPGRIVGQTHDAEGRRAYVLTLQAREQHIRREKASSNVCSNQALCALAAGVYLSCMGPAGLARAADSSMRLAHYLAARLGEIDGFALMHDGPFFNEFAMTCPIDPHALEGALAERGILSGLPLEGGMLWCATEVNTKEQIDELVGAVRAIVEAAPAATEAAQEVA